MFKQNSQAVSFVSGTESAVSAIECSSSGLASSSQDNKDTDLFITLNNILKNKKAEDIFQGCTNSISIQDLIKKTIHYGMNILHYAVLVDNASIVDTLIKEGANLSFQDVQGRTPLHYAQSVQVAQLLINAGAEINAQDNEHQNILTIAYIRENFDVVQYLLNNTQIDVSNTKQYSGIPEGISNNEEMFKCILVGAISSDEYDDLSMIL